MDNGKIKQAIEESMTVKLDMLQIVPIIELIAKEIKRAYDRGNKLIIFGNGGSMSDAMHFGAELEGKFRIEKEPLAVIIPSNPSSLTCIGNDYSFGDIFTRVVEAHASSDDIVIGISTSGNSLNVINAIKKAKDMRCITIGFTGSNPCMLDGCTDICLKIPSSNTPRIQEGHITVIHAICEMLE